MSNKAAPGSWLTDNEAEHIMDDAFLVIEKADTLEEKANFLVVYQKASLLKHFMDTLKSDFTVQNMVADAEVDRDTQLQIDSVFVHAHQQIGKRLDEDLLLIDDYIAAAEDEKLRELFRRLKTATIEVRDTIEASLETKTFD
ncbi:hypothetical protein [Roseimaritima ulvae]|nr:hypothetical protein [Roseimaritima ulvae]